MANTAGLSGNQLANAQRIISIGKARGESARNIEIAIMTALTESGLQMYANSNVPSSLNYPHDAVGHDHNSLGLFQQQTPGWGTVAQLMDPNVNVNKFYDALDSKNTTGLTEWAAAQKVQVSAYSDGSNYHSQLARAQGIMTALYGSTPSGTAPPAGGAAPPSGANGAYFNPADPVGTLVAFLSSIKGTIDAIGAVTTTTGKIATELTTPAFWARVGWFALGAFILIVVAAKLFADTDTGGAVVQHTKTAAKAAASTAVKAAVAA